MLVVSGCPRSGTSLMMDIMRAMLGHDRILGDQYPMQHIMKLFDDESVSTKMTPKVQQALRYSYEKQHPNWRDEIKEYMDMNPQGYWECKYTTNGIKYSVKDIEDLTRFKSEPRNRLSVCKLVSQGLYQSDPAYIDKVIFMVRNPREVAKSQERLKKVLMVRDKNDKVVNALEDVKVHSPAMFINVSLWAAKWFVVNPHIPVHIVLFDDVISNPEGTLTKVSDFLGEGIVQNALPRIRKDLKRSNSEDIESNLWEDATVVYSYVLQKKWGDIVEYFEEERDATEEKKRWHCTRRDSIASRIDCERCMSNPTVRNNFRKTATERNIIWTKEPCMFEVAFDSKSKEHFNVQESIEKNFWLHNNPIR